MNFVMVWLDHYKGQVTVDSVLSLLDHYKGQVTVDSVLSVDQWAQA